MTGSNTTSTASVTSENEEVTTFPVFELSLDASSDIAGLAIAVSSLSDAVEEVRVDIYNSFTIRWNEEGVPELFEALGRVPQLRKVEFYGLRIFPYRMPIVMAERTLATATRLEEFSLVGINLCEEEADPNGNVFSRFSETLRHHPTLKTFALDNCRLRDEETGPTLDEAIVEPLVQIPSLEKVSLELFVFSKCGSAFLFEMAKALIQANNQSQLEDLSISGCLGGMKGAKTISEMIRVNTSLKSLELHLRSRTEDDDEEGIRELSKALGRNKTLAKFQLHGATNRTGSLETRNIFLQMLESNYALKSGVQVFHPGFLRPENELYLRLNQVGRGRLLLNGLAKREWVDTLIKVRQDLDCLFYFLSTNPSLCNTVGDAFVEEISTPKTPMEGVIPSETTNGTTVATTSTIQVSGCKEPALDCVNRKRKRSIS
ncbi:expressed unknown protein [Seminavis robusta]|uniref:Uncharacterized protein n=1 Tax=Seminavis robusta TaxID=568900 RepID=A0A9N8DVI1_9STRA|nr:expressed unknown protein [Seminavis robusta]|eukprot:Sro276_g106050.1 n/a (431) ;mRNA; f:53004-54381